MILIKKLKSKIKNISFLRLVTRFFRLKEMSHFPEQIQIETTSCCNSACITCNHKTMCRTKAHMSLELFKKIINECAKNKKSIKRVALFFMGEPLLNSEIFEEIRYTKAQGLKNIFLISNGSLLDEEKAKKIIEAGLDEIVFSIDGATKESFERIRKGLNFDSVVSNITRLIELKKELNRSNPKVVIDVVITPGSEKEVDGLKMKWQKMGVSVNVRPLHYFEGIDDSLIKYAEEKTNEVAIGFPCPYLWKGMSILQDGRVAMCCIDVEGTYELGDLKKSTIKEIWQGEIIKKYRQQHLTDKKQDIKICAKCNFYKVKNRPWWWF